jgi:hypothetical protein
MGTEPEGSLIKRVSVVHKCKRAQSVLTFVLVMGAIIRKVFSYNVIEFQRMRKVLNDAHARQHRGRLVPQDTTDMCIDNLHEDLKTL